MLKVEGSWLWDFWLADDDERFHLFYLNAPHSLGSPHRRHRAARIGHAVSDDLRDWTVVGGTFDAGEPDSFDATATWTGSVVQGDDGLWHMFYTGSRFLADEPDHANVETVGLATSSDLVTWTKHAGPLLQADPRWYETLGTSTWPEEAYRDPWVFRDPQGDGWHMLVTARANHGADDDRGVVGHAWSADLDSWEQRPPLSAAGSGFAHLEVLQTVEVDGAWFLLFSCGRETLAASRRASVPDAGTWAVRIDSPTGPFNLRDAVPLTGHDLYSGRITRDRSGRSVLLAFENADGDFPGVICDPIPVSVAADGRLLLRDAAEAISG